MRARHLEVCFPRTRAYAMSLASHQPIASAPKDGTIILVGWADSPHVTRAYWSRGRWVALLPRCDSRYQGEARLIDDPPEFWWPSPTSEKGPRPLN